MTDHQFEPGQLVLVRNSDEHKWRLLHYSHFRNSADEHFFATIGERDYRYCLPFNDDTKHLQNTTQPYEPPKPPVEYEWGQKVEVFQNGEWRKAMFIEPYYSPSFDGAGATVMPLGKLTAVNYPPDRMRPLTDTAAHLDAKP